MRPVPGGDAGDHDGARVARCNAVDDVRDLVDLAAVLLRVEQVGAVAPGPRHDLSGQLAPINLLVEDHGQPLGAALAHQLEQHLREQQVVGRQADEVALAARPQAHGSGAAVRAGSV